VPSDSQNQAVLVLKIVFAYLMGVRYLAVNPWSAVDLTKVPVAVNRMQIEKAMFRRKKTRSQRVNLLFLKL
jgi:hypothetical protein